MHSHLFLGTSGWSYQDWLGNFYPQGTPSSEFLSIYAQSFNTVEIDSTFYRIPSKQMVQRWKAVTPNGFLFSAKVPQVITHEKMLKDCDAEVNEFLQVMDGLGEKLGPIVFQFSYGFQPAQFPALKAFLPKLPSGYRFALEVRHRGWLKEEFYDLLRQHNIALVLVDHPWMPRLKLTTHPEFVYIRWLGDRKKVSEPFNEIKLDRTQNLQWWVPIVKDFLDLDLDVFGYFNNHFAGHAPSSLEQFRAMLAQ